MRTSRRPVHSRATKTSHHEGSRSEGDMGVGIKIERGRIEPEKEELAEEERERGDTRSILQDLSSFASRSGERQRER